MFNKEREREKQYYTMEDSSHSTSSLSSLTCQETDQTCLNKEVDEEDTFINLTNYIASNTEEEHEYVQMLLEREISTTGFKHHKSSHTFGSWIKCARLDAITWILKTQALLGFCLQTAFLSVNYLDRFLSKRTIESEKYWAIRLLSVACLSLAAKMEERIVPVLSEFPGEDYRFESKVIQRMEVLVLNTLEWKMGSITPFAYVHYFITCITKLCKVDYPPRNIMSTSVELILTIMRDVDFMDYRPSVIAVAATLVALDQKLTRQTLESKINALSFNGLLEIGDVSCCCKRMQEVDREKIN